MNIHTTALIENGAQIGANCTIGPFAHIGPEVVLGDNSTVMTHAVITGATTIGEGAKIFHHAVLGGLPQNTAHKGGKTTLTIGRNCTIREGVTMHVGTDMARGATVVGDNCMFLAYSHVAHDCVIGNRVTFANNVMIGGHCEIGDNVIIGGGGGVHQFCRLGNNSFIGGLAGVAGDLIPFGMVISNAGNVAGINIVGMKRAGISRDEINAMRKAFKMLFDRNFPIQENVARIKEAFPGSAVVKQVLDFIGAGGKRPFSVPLLDAVFDDSPLED